MKWKRFLSISMAVMAMALAGCATHRRDTSSVAVVSSPSTDNGIFGGTPPSSGAAGSNAGSP